MLKHSPTVRIVIFAVVFLCKLVQNIWSTYSKLCAVNYTIEPMSAYVRKRLELLKPFKRSLGAIKH